MKSPIKLDYISKSNAESEDKIYSVFKMILDDVDREMNLNKQLQNITNTYENEHSRKCAD